MRTLRQMQNKLSGLQKLMPLALLLPISGCTTLTTGTRYLDTSCAAFRDITYSSKHDSAETVKQIRGHNAAYDAICNPGKSP